MKKTSRLRRERFYKRRRPARCQAFVSPIAARSRDAERAHAADWCGRATPPAPGSWSVAGSRPPCRSSAPWTREIAGGGYRWI